MLSLPLSVSPTPLVVIPQGLIIGAAYIVYYKLNSRKRKRKSIFFKKMYEVAWFIVFFRERRAF